MSNSNKHVVAIIFNLSMLHIWAFILLGQMFICHQSHIYMLSFSTNNQSLFFLELRSSPFIIFSISLIWRDIDTKKIRKTKK